MLRYADVYTSRVSNLLRYTPYAYFRAGQQSLAHDGDDLAVFLESKGARGQGSAAGGGKKGGQAEGRSVAAE